MLKVVFDTVVFVRSLINPHSICGHIVFAHSHRYRLFLSEPVVREILEVLHRPELTRKVAGLATFDLPALIELLGRAEIVHPEPGVRASRDPADDQFLATAKAAGADYLVSEDKDLLVLAEYEGTKIVNAARFLEILGQLPESAS